MWGRAGRFATCSGGLTPHSLSSLWSLVSSMGHRRFLSCCSICFLRASASSLRFFFRAASALSSGERKMLASFFFSTAFFLSDSAFAFAWSSSVWRCFALSFSAFFFCRLFGFCRRLLLSGPLRIHFEGILYFYETAIFHTLLDG